MGLSQEEIVVVTLSVSIEIELKPASKFEEASGIDLSLPNSIPCNRNRKQIKLIAADSTASLALLHRNQLFQWPTLSRNYKNKFLANLCSLVKADSSRLSSRTGKGRHKSEKKLEKEKSYTVAYLINSCGLSPEKAVSASEKVRFDNPEKPNSVMTMLTNYGFSKTQIATVVGKRPRILLAKEKTLLPKLEFFQSIGIPKAHFTTTMSRDPTLLTRSLENKIIPNYNFLKSMLLTDGRIAAAMKRTSWIFLEDPEKNLAPNVAVLREHEVPNSCITLLLTHYPETVMLKTDKFRESVKEVLEMGFNPLRTVFVLALHALSGNANRMIWARSYETYRNWGWSKDDIYTAFRKQPNCMMLSQNKISRTMDFLVNKMGWNTRTIMGCPSVLFLNLENRIIPRCSVIQVLLSRGLIAKEGKLSSLLLPVEALFLKKFVEKYEKEVPKLYDFYKGKIGVQEL